MTQLPANWRVEALGDVADVTMGQSPPGSSYNEAGVGLPFFQGKAEFRDLHPEVRKYTTAGKKFAGAGDILLSVRAPVGPTNVAQDDCAVGRGLAAIRARSGVDQRYLLWALRATVSDLESKATGSTFSAVSGKQVRSHALPIAPQLDQRRIVELLEDHLSRLDAAEAALRQAPDRLATFKASAAVHALRPSAVSGIGAVMKFGAVELPLPSSWRASTVGDEAVLVEYGSGAKATPLESVDAVPVLRMGNVKDGRVVWDSLKYLPSDHPDVAKLRLRAGDLLFNRTNSAELVGKSAVFGGEREATFASYLIRARFAEDVNPHWANLVINSLYGRAYVDSVVSQQVGQANVNGTKLRAFPLPVPPRGAQDQIVDLLREQDQAGYRIAAQMERSLAQIEALRRSLLQAAFTGRLTGRVSDLEVAAELAGV